MLANRRREAKHRRALRTLFGRPLTTRDGVPERRLRRTQKRRQRVNGADSGWYSEEARFSVFILENLAWQRGVELSKGKIRRTSRG